MTNQNLQKIELLLLALDTDRQKLADELQLDRTTVSKTLSGTRTARVTREAIADAIATRARALVLSEAQVSAV